MTADISVAETAKAAEFFLSDGIIVTGTATGMQTDPEELRGETGHIRLHSVAPIMNPCAHTGLFRSLVVPLTSNSQC